MMTSSQLKVLLTVFLIGLFISQGCVGSSSTQAFPTLSNVTVTATMPAALLAAAQVIVTAIETDQPDMLRSLIGEEGVAAGGFAQDAQFKGYNNADEIIVAFTQALDQSTPVCEGFVPYIGALPDKATLVYRGMEFDWNQFGLSGNSSGGMTLQLFKLSEGWRLVGITPFDFEWGLPIIEPLQACPVI